MDAKLVRLYKKLTIANLLNWFAMRLFRVATEFCSILILGTIYLDSSRSIFKKNILFLKKINIINFHLLKNDPFPFILFQKDANFLVKK